MAARVLSRARTQTGLDLRAPGRKPVGPLRMRDVRVRTQDVGDTGTPRPQFALLDRRDLVNGRYVAQSSRTDYADGSFFATLNDADCDGLESHDSENHTWCFHFKTQASVTGYLLAKTDESAGNRVLRFSLSSATNLQCLLGDTTGNWANFNLTLPVTLQPNTEYFLTIRETGNESGVTGYKREVFINRQATLTSNNGTTEDFTYKNTTADWTLGGSNIPVFAFVKYDVSLTDEQVYSIHDDFYGFHFEPANSAQFLIGLPGGGGAFDETATVAATVVVTASESYTGPGYSETAAIAGAPTITATESYAAPGFAETATVSATATVTAAEAYTAPSYSETAAIAAMATVTAAETFTPPTPPTPAYDETATITATATVTASEAFTPPTPAYDETANVAGTVTVTAAETYSGPTYSETAQITFAALVEASEIYVGPGSGETASITGTVTVTASETYAPPAFDETALIELTATVVAHETFYTPSALPPGITTLAARRIGGFYARKI